MNAEVIDQATAQAALAKVRDDLLRAADGLSTATDGLRTAIITARPQGVLTVDQMAQAIGRDRNYVDSIWSEQGQIARVDGRIRQTRVTVTDDVDQGKVDAAAAVLRKVADDQRRQANEVKTARAERDRVVAMVYQSKLLGPSAIAAEVKVDRNHVLRIARRAGVRPVHRVSSKNQYTTTGN